MADETTPNWGIPLMDEETPIDSINGLYNAQSTALEVALDGALGPAEPIMPTGDTPGMIPAGTTAQRDAYWGVPASASARVALANKGARWFNLDKGYEQQYFAWYSDASVTPTTPVQASAGWAAAAHLGRVPLSIFTVTGAGVTKLGGLVNVSAASTCRLDGVFSSDFENYIVEVEIDSANADGDIYVQFRAGGVTNADSQYRVGIHEFSGINGNLNVITPTTDTSGRSLRFSSFGGTGTIKISRPAAAKRTFAMIQSHDVDRYYRGGGFHFDTNATFDGFLLTSGTSWTGRVRVYGINDV